MFDEVELILTLQNFRQYFGRFFCTLALSYSLSLWLRSTIAVAPLGQASSRWRLGVVTTKAVTLTQSSLQYHHLSSLLPQGGNGTHESQVQRGQGECWASPFMSMIRVDVIKARLIITPKKRMNKCFACVVHGSSMPKKFAESL